MHSAHLCVITHKHTHTHTRTHTHSTLTQRKFIWPIYYSHIRTLRRPSARANPGRNRHSGHCNDSEITLNFIHSLKQWPRPRCRAYARFAAAPRHKKKQYISMFILKCVYELFNLYNYKCIPNKGLLVLPIYNHLI